MAVLWDDGHHFEAAAQGRKSIAVRSYCDSTHREGTARVKGGEGHEEHKESNRKRETQREKERCSEKQRGEKTDNRTRNKRKEEEEREAKRRGTKDKEGSVRAIHQHVPQNRKMEPAKGEGPDQIERDDGAGQGDCVVA
jgi:hypothetical protein